MKRSSWQTLSLILLVSVALRVAMALYLGNVVDAPPLLQDQRSYAALGERLITGHGFSFDRGWYPFTEANTPTAHWSFLYSIFVAIVYLIFGVQPLAVRVVQAILGGILLPWLVYRFSRRLYQASPINPISEKLNELGFSGERLALLSAGLAAVYFYFVLYAATIMTETFYITALLWTLEIAIGLAEQPTLQRGILLGVALGITTLLRQSVLPWLLVMFIWLMWVGWCTAAWKRTLGALVSGSALLVLFIAPFTIRNYIVYHDFLLLNSNAGYAMYSAQHPAQGTQFQEFIAIPIPTELAGQNEAQLDRALMRLGTGYVLADPGRYVLLSLSRVPDYFEFWPTADTTFINNLGRVGSFGLFLPFMIVGLVLALRYAGPRALGSWKRFSFTPLALTVLFIIVYSTIHILTWALPRYRLPVDAVAMPFAALALGVLAKTISDRSKKERLVKS